MNPVILFSFLLLVGAATMLRLPDRSLVRLLGVSVSLVATPAALLTTALDWKVELAKDGPTFVGYSLLVVGFVGSLFLAAGLLSTVLRLAFPARLNVSASSTERFGDETKIKIQTNNATLDNGDL